jgi:pimeloyl-ACP methyl ester carboxylesterase
MIALLCRLLWLGLIALTAAIAVFGAQPWWRALLTVVLGFLVIKTIICGVSFALAYVANRDDAVGFRVHPLRFFYGFVEEIWATTRGVLELMPWRVSQQLDRPTAPAPHRLPVLMIHGFVCNRGYWIPTAQTLVERGYVVDSITLEPAFGSIDAYVGTIHHAVEALCAESNKQQVVVVCHSMGGLAVRAYMRAHGDGRIRHAITVGTPHHGTAIAHLGIGKNARQMERGHPWQAALSASEPPLRYTKFTTIYSRIDNIVAPARTAVLPSAREIELDDVGHVAMAIAPRCQHVILEEVERVSAA